MAACVLIGGGGHAKVVIECLRAAGTDEPVAIVDPKRELWGTSVLGVPVIGDESKLVDFARLDAVFAIGVGAIGTGRQRQLLFERALAAGLRPVTVCHPSAIVAPSVWMGRGCQIFPRAVVNADARLGDNVIVNTAAIVEHDCRVGDHAHIATGACLASTVEVGIAALVGAGAAVKQCLRIGDDAVVGVGAVVIADVPAGSIVAGVPAQPLSSKS